MDIAQLQLQPHNTKIGGFVLTIKTCKKTWQVGKVWFQQIVWMESSGEIPVDVKIGKYNPLNRGSEINVIISTVRDAEYLGKPCKVLFVEQYSLPTMTADEYNSQEDDWLTAQQDKIKGMIRHGIVCALIQRVTTEGKINIVPNKQMKNAINEVVDFIITGE